MLHGSVGDSKMADTTGTQPPRPSCSLLLFVATPAEDEAMERAANKLGLRLERDAELKKVLVPADTGACVRLLLNDAPPPGELCFELVQLDFFLFHLGLGV